MANLALRSPQFKTIVAGVGVQSSVLELRINGVLKYTLIKNKTISSSITQAFDISELARDYIDIIYENNYIPISQPVGCLIRNYDGLNGTGSQVGANVSYSDIGLEGYGNFEEEVNPDIPFRNTPTYMIPRDNLGPSIINTFTILAPIGEPGKIPSISASNLIYATSYSASDTSVTNNDGVVCNIKRIDCTKYTPKKIVYINKYGAQQDLWFFLKNSKNLARTNEGFKSNTMVYETSGPEYSVQNATNKIINTQAKQTHTLNSGFYPEFANQFFEELLLSEYVWLDTLKKGVGVTIPVKVKNASVAFKTTLNDKLIDYTIVFEEAFDYINNIR
tara:strand:- start:3098 stop:4096 length:999 start_codon:yes stop_codon:yes gene_type:complete